MPFSSVDDYVRAQPEATQAILEELRRRARRAAPGGVETISYNMPTVTLEGRKVIHFAAWKTHVALYPSPDDDPELARETEPYRAARSTLRFPLNKPIPYELIERIFAHQPHSALNDGVFVGGEQIERRRFRVVGRQRHAILIDDQRIAGLLVPHRHAVEVRVQHAAAIRLSGRT